MNSGDMTLTDSLAPGPPLWAIPALAALLLVASTLGAYGAKAIAPITRVDGVLLVPVALNGQGPYQFMLDFEARQVVVDGDIAQSLSLGRSAVAMVENEAGDSAFASLSPIESLDVGGLRLPANEAMVMDLSGLKSRLGTPVAGILPGRITGKTLECDFQFGRLVVTDGAFGPAGQRAADTIKAQLDDGPPAVMALLNGEHSRPLALDPTFAGTLALSEAALEEMGVMKENTPRLSIERVPEDGPPPLGHTQVRIASLRVGTTEIAGPVCAVLDPTGRDRLGLGFLEHFRVTISQTESSGALWLERVGSGPLRAPAIVGYGLSLARFRDGFWHVDVAKGSPAARAGIAAGSALVRINGRIIKNLSYETLAARLAAGEGNEIELGLRHGDEERTVELVAERLL